MGGSSFSRELQEVIWIREGSFGGSDTAIWAFSYRY